ncbi:MAG: heme ABC exporter ATP-binding protein CcmA [Anaerolineae bacterium]|nr:heme ABC exporter ATP-binding protein CcmA [Anaerolineae bacterium]
MTTTLPLDLATTAQVSQSASTPARAIVQLCELVKAYEDMPVLRGINLELARGEMVALLGPNGSGKSTLLKLLAGLIKPTAGRVVIGGWELPRESVQVRAQIGLVSHKLLLYEGLTARENLMFFAQLYNLSRSEALKRVEQLLAQVGLSARADDVVRSFSRGMQQRLSIARALVHNPSILLLDEPYTGLDQDASASLDVLLRSARVQGHTILMVTHQIEHAAQLADRLLILSRGVIAWEGRGGENGSITGDELARRYTQVTGLASLREHEE